MMPTGTLCRHARCSMCRVQVCRLGFMPTGARSDALRLSLTLHACNMLLALYLGTYALTPLNTEQSDTELCI